MSIIGAFMVPHPPIIVEEIGHRREEAVDKVVAAYEKVAIKIAELKPKTIIITSPHSILYNDYFHISSGSYGEGDFSEFGASKLRFKVPYDMEFINQLEITLEENGFMGGTKGTKKPQLDHGTMVPVYFIHKFYKDYKIVRIGLSGQSYQTHYALGQYIKQVSEQLDTPTVFIASGDLSHKLTPDGPYGFAEEGPIYDKKIMEVMGSGDFLNLFQFEQSFCDKAAECGHRSFLIMAGALDRTKVKADTLAYEGPFGVGYGICSYIVEGQDDSRDFLHQYMEEYRNKIREKMKSEDEYIRLARQSLESFVVSHKKMRVPKELSEDILNNQAGVFVSIYKEGQLRGCIGTIIPTKDSLASEIIANAISAGIEDPRFSPIEEKELKDLEYHVDVLGKTQPVQTINQLDPHKYGVIVKSGRKRGLLLPDLDGIDTIEEQISIARKKAGISDYETITMERFEVIRHQ